MSDAAKTMTLSVRADVALVDEFKALVESEERDVSKDIRRYMRQRVDRAKRDKAAKAA